jgi:uncharacterized membrane protein YccC
MLSPHAGVIPAIIGIIHSSQRQLTSDHDERRGTVGGLRETWDRVVASDPGLSRLRMAGCAAVAMATALAVEYGFAVLTGAPAQGRVIAMMLGAIVAMMGSMALTGSGVWNKVRTAAFFPVALGVGMAVGVTVGAHTDLMLGVFVLVMFAAVYIRRFGLPYFFYGFMGWMGYFFSTFLHATWPMVPSLLVAIVVGTAWVLLLSVTVLRTNPTRTLRRTVRAFDARARAVARAGADLLAAGHPAHAATESSRPARRLRAQQARLADVALMVEGWSAEPAALPEDWSAAALRRRLIDAHQAVDGIASAADALATADTEVRVAALPVLDLLARREDTAAEQAAHALADAAAQAGADAHGWWPARHLAAAALEFTSLVRTRETPAEDEEIDEFEPAVSLALGNLPGSPAVARDVAAGGSRWNPLVKRAMTTRQAVQVAVAGGLAIVIGREVSATRYYWAVIAAFIMFTGTGSRSETFVKGFNRVLGTLAGLFVSIWVAHLTNGHTWLILTAVIGSVFCGFYLLRLSYAYMIFFITIMVGQLYTVLHRFSDGIMVLRLEETVIGAVIGFAVAMVVVPVSTRDTVRTARDNLLTSLSELLRAVADRLEGVAPQRGENDDETPRPLDQLARAVDDRVRQLALVAKPLLRPLVWGNSPPRSRHRVALYGATATHARGLTVALRRHTGPTESPAAACRALAAAADVLVETPPGRREPTAQEPLEKADAALYADPCESGARPAPGTDPVLRHLIHLHQLLHEIATPGSPTPSSAHRPGPEPLPVTEAEGARP